MVIIESTHHMGNGGKGCMKSMSSAWTFYFTARSGSTTSWVILSPSVSIELLQDVFSCIDHYCTIFCEFYTCVIIVYSVIIAKLIIDLDLVVDMNMWLW